MDRHDLDQISSVQFDFHHPVPIGVLYFACIFSSRHAADGSRCYDCEHARKCAVSAAPEALIMEVTIELLREAGLRLPNPLGQTIGLVGGVVIGQAAVEANIVSSVMVIIVSIIALASFTVPQYGMGLSFRVLRFISMVAAAVFGLYGIILCMLAIFTHLARQRSFGIPYFNPNHFSA